MTIRVKPTSAPKRRRSTGDSEERFQLLVTAGFIGLIVAVVLILVGAVAFAYYDAHFRPIASVGSTTITRDQWASRANLELLRINNQEARIRAQIAAGQLDGTAGDGLITSLESTKQNLTSTSAEDLVNLVYKGQLAEGKGIALSDADVQAKMNADGSNPERRHVYAIIVEPKPAVSTAAVTAKDRQQALENATKAAAALASGTSFEQVAQQYSTDASKDLGGDYGVIDASNSVDAAWVQALFALPLNGTTPVIRGADGTYRIGSVREINPSTVDPNFARDVVNKVGDQAYGDNIRLEALADKLEASVIADATAGNVDQVRLAEIYIGVASGSTPDTDKGTVHASHILYSPAHDPANQASLPPDDPAWTQARDSAQKTVDALNAIKDVAQREAKFAELAKSDSDDKTSGANGGDLGFFGLDSGFVTEFTDPLFNTPNLKPGDVIGPIKSQFGFHVILFQERTPGSADRLKAVTDALAKPGADFAAIAGQYSDGNEALIGGELGWRTKSQLPTSLADAVFALQAGQVTASVQLPDGYHIDKVEERSTRPLDQAQIAEISATAFTQWYDPQKTKAEKDKVITRDQSVFSSTQPTPSGG
jgi:parvulin-like peptidyl-prolyl isomerase